MHASVHVLFRGASGSAGPSLVPVPQHSAARKDNAATWWRRRPPQRLADGR